jgi:hypothetical protein
MLKNARRAREEAFLDGNDVYEISLGIAAAAASTHKGADTLEKVTFWSP